MTRQIIPKPTRTVTIPDNSMKNEVVNLLAVPWELRAILLASVTRVGNESFRIVLSTTSMNLHRMQEQALTLPCPSLSHYLTPIASVN
jgi:hypothetical protein